MSFVQILQKISNHNWLRKQTSFTKTDFNVLITLKLWNLPINHKLSLFNKDKTNLIKNKTIYYNNLLGLAKKGWLPVVFFTDF